MKRRQSARPGYPRRFSSHLRQYQLGEPSTSGYGTLSPGGNHLTTYRTNDELEHLLEEQHEDEEHADSDGLYPPNCCWTADEDPPKAADLYGHYKWPVYDNIHMIRHEIINSIDDPYSLDQLKAPRMNISVVRPLVDQFYDLQDLSIVYCLLVNRTQFIREQSYATHHQTVNLTRALLCEIVAEKILRRYNEHNPGPKGLLKLANILVAGFEPFQNAPESVLKSSHHIITYVRKKGGKLDHTMTALEVAIVSESKAFLANTACQKVVDAIYRGKLVYTPNSFIDILPDYWKRRPISLYDPRHGPLLNQYRLSVPRTRNMIEIGQFVILLVLYLIVMEGRESRNTITYTAVEVIFDLYSWGWILDQAATMLEHGWAVYTQNLWSFLDVTYSLLFAFYFFTRMHALSQSDPDDMMENGKLALDALSCAAPVLIPRLAFNLMSENLVFLCLRDMLANFLTLVLLASWCFIGFLLTLKWLHNGLHQPLTIGKWMIWIWFGLDGTGIEKAPDFHWLLGPTIMIMFAFLGNTLFVTILVSMLSNTFSTISANAVQEMHYRRAVLTFEGVKADALFAYMPPVNLLVIFTLLPLKFVLTPRWFHKVNVFSVKVINAPLLLTISLYERRTLWISNRVRRAMRPREVDWQGPNGPRAAPSAMGWMSRTFQFWDLSRFSAHGDMQAVFDEVPEHLEEDSHQDPSGAGKGIGRSLHQQFMRQFENGAKNKKNKISSRAGSPEMNTSTTNGDGKKKSGINKNISSSVGALEEEFASDSDEGDDESGMPKGYQKVRRGTRKDSIMDYHGSDAGAGLLEANARLHKLEESMARMESLLMRVIGDSRNGTDADDDDGDDGNIGTVKPDGEIEG